MLARLREPELEARRRYHFASLNCEQQADAIRRLAAAGHGETTISAATSLSVEQIRRVLDEHPIQGGA